MATRFGAMPGGRRWYIVGGLVEVWVVLLRGRLLVVIVHLWAEHVRLKAKRGGFHMSKRRFFVFFLEASKPF